MVINLGLINVNLLPISMDFLYEPYRSPIIVRGVINQKKELLANFHTTVVQCGPVRIHKDEGALTKTSSKRLPQQS